MIKQNTSPVADYFRDEAKHLRRDLESGDPVRIAGARYRMERERPDDKPQRTRPRHREILDTLAREQHAKSWRAFTADLGETPIAEQAMDDSMELLALLFVLGREARHHGEVALEVHIEDPYRSNLFAAFEKVMERPLVVEFICDTFKTLMTGYVDRVALESLLEADLASDGWPEDDRILATSAGRALVAYAAGDSPGTVAEYARRSLPLDRRPTFSELEAIHRHLSARFRSESSSRWDKPHADVPESVTGEGTQFAELVALWEKLEARDFARVDSAIDVEQLVLVWDQMPDMVRSSYTSGLPERRGSEIRERVARTRRYSQRQFLAAVVSLLEETRDLEANGEIWFGPKESNG